MSRIVKAKPVEAFVAPTKLVEEKNSINLSDEAQMKLFRLVLNTPPGSSEQQDAEENPKNLAQKAS